MDPERMSWEMPGAELNPGLIWFESMILVFRICPVMQVDSKIIC